MKNGKYLPVNPSPSGCIGGCGAGRRGAGRRGAGRRGGRCGSGDGADAEGVGDVVWTMSTEDSSEAVNPSEFTFNSPTNTKLCKVIG
jgi:hypothetical protein